MSKKQFPNSSEIINNVYKFKREEIDITTLMGNDLYRYLYTLNPQKSTHIFETIILKDFDLEVVSQQLDRGDYKTKDGKYLEVKISVIDSKDDVINIVQIRPHQDLYGYLVFAIDYISDITHPILYFLTSKQMKLEIKKHGTPSHGVKDKPKTYPEFSIRIPIDNHNGILKEWDTLYRNWRFPDILLHNSSLK